MCYIKRVFKYKLEMSHNSTMPRLLRPHLVPKSVVLSLPHLHSNFFASGSINLENHWNDYENREGMVDSKP